MDKLSIYLAGPITGLKLEEAQKWREDFKVKYRSLFDVYNPLDRLPNYEGKSGQELFAAIADGDRMDILSCDATLAYVDRPSMGTAMGIMYAFLSGRTVVIVRSKEEFALSEMLLYHAHKVCDKIDEAVDFIIKRHNRQTIKTVLKRNGTPVVWDPTRIRDAIQAAIDGNQDKLTALRVRPPSADKLATTVIMQLEDALEDGRIDYDDLDIETIQDMVEKVLMDNSHRSEVHTLAKEYIAYRRKKQEAREININHDETLDFIKDILHDIKSPTGNIGRLIGSLQTFLECNNIEEALNDLEDIKENQDSLMKHLIDCKRRGDDRFRKEPINLNACIAKEFESYSQRDIKFWNQVPSDFSVEAIPKRLRTVFRNLIDNSIRHGLEGGKGNIFVRGRHVKNGDLLIEYCNDGKKISRKDAEHIFSNVKRSIHTSESFQHGMGQVKRYVEELEGSIECIPMKIRIEEDDFYADQADYGSPVFKISLPIYKGHTGQKKVILVADDVANDRRMLKRILEKANYEVVEANTINTALEVIDRMDLYGASLDIDFKEDRDGIWLLKYLFENKPEARTIVVSSVDSSSRPKDWRREAEQYGADGTFDKGSYTEDQILRCFES
ncbi:ATP cone domain-containing protein [Thermodesulfobacteriota bacterium]